MTPFSFIQITDSHIGQAFVPDGKALEDDLNRISTQHQKECDFIFATGDLTDRGKREEFAEVARVFRASQMKIHTVIGDHDQWDGEWGPKNLKVDNYCEYFGSTNNTFLHKGVYFISYDCVTGRQEWEPSAWLRSELDSLEKERPIILLSHRPVADAFFKTLKQYPIKACLSGHWHSSRMFERNGIFHATCPSLCFGGIDFSPRGYRLFHWDGFSLTGETRSFSVPATPVLQDKSIAKVLWQTSVGAKSVLGGPVVSGEAIFTSGMIESGVGKGILMSIDKNTGKGNWRIPMTTSVKNSPAISKNKVIVVTVTGEVQALEKSTGVLLWKSQLGEPTERWVYSAPVVGLDKIFVGSAGCFSALDVESGKSLWTLQPDRTALWSDWISSPATPATDGQRVYLGFLWRNGSVAAIDAGSGKIIWSLQGPISPISPFAIEDGRLYFHSNAGEVFCLLAETGEVLWTHPLGENWSPAAPLAWQDKVYCASGNGRVFALEQSSGKRVWEWECPGTDLNFAHPYRRVGKAIFSSPRICNNALLVGACDGTMTTLDLENGKSIHQVQLGQSISATPEVIGKNIYLRIGSDLLAIEWS